MGSAIKMDMWWCESVAPIGNVLLGFVSVAGVGVVVAIELLAVGCFPVFWEHLDPR
jgi:hypothetical protein